MQGGNAAKEISSFKNDIYRVLAEMVVFRDPVSGEHMKRTAALTQALLDHLLTKPYYKALLEPDYDVIIHAALLHDIGKIAIPDSVLLKPDRLTSEEFEMVKTHCETGADMLAKMEGSFDKEVYTICRDVCLYHHEYWDGSGYPYGLKGEKIPLNARIVAIADVYDALVNERPYKQPYDHHTAFKIITEKVGTQFDPDIIEALQDITTLAGNAYFGV